MITASIVTYKSKYEDVKRILECSVSSIIDIIYVIDNSPSFDLKKIVDDFHSSKIQYLWGHGNIGFGRANNIGLKKAIDIRASYHVILNPDIIFESSSIDKMNTFMNLHKEIGMLTPRLIYPDGRLQPAAMRFPTPYDMLGRRLFPKFFRDKINKRYELETCDMSVARYIPSMCGCFMFIRTDILKLSGLFDERFFMYFEDFDLVRRVHKHSRIAYTPNSTVIHAHGAEHRTSFFLFKESIKSAIQYFNKWGWFYDPERRKWNKDVYYDSSIIK